MANVLTEETILTCPNKGVVSKSSKAKLRVGGSPVLLENQAPDWTIPVAPDPNACTQTNTQAGEKPCTKAVLVTMGQAAKLTVGGSKVLLDSLQATTDGVPNKKLSASPGAAKLQAD